MRVSTNKRVGAAEVAECVTLAPRLWIAATVGGELCVWSVDGIAKMRPTRVSSYVPKVGPSEFLGG
jgi:hypothetical protein